MVNFEHMSLGQFTRIAKYFLKHHGYVAHQIDWVIVDHDLPRKIVLLGSASLLLDYRTFD